jgi:hypothetical protein
LFKIKLLDVILERVKDTAAPNRAKKSRNCHMHHTVALRLGVVLYPAKRLESLDQYLL